MLAFPIMKGGQMPQKHVLPPVIQSFPLIPTSGSNQSVRLFVMTITQYLVLFVLAEQLSQDAMGVAMSFGYISTDASQIPRSMFTKLRASLFGYDMNLIEVLWLNARLVDCPTDTTNIIVSFKQVKEWMLLQIYKVYTCTLAALVN
jgi:hypothetical protein